MSDRMFNQEQYTTWVDRVNTLEARKRLIEASIERDAEARLASRQVLPGTTAEHLANGAKASDDRLRDLDKRIDRAVARATMYGLGMLSDRIQDLR